MKRLITVLVLAGLTLCGVYAQRKTDNLDRGLIAIKTNSGIFCSWRILGEEYYDVTYNLYRDGQKIKNDLKVSNYTDPTGTANSKYTIKAVVRGVESTESSKEATAWATNYLEINPDHGSLQSTFEPNDACVADVDGDGELEILIKMWNISDAHLGYPKAGANGEYSIIEVYKLDGTRLWWIDCGPNLMDFQFNETNIAAFDWDQDGKAEAIMRAADGTTIHAADGTPYVIGDNSKNYRFGNYSGQWFIYQGDEYLVYMDGATGKPYSTMEYPLKRLETGETNLEKAWGDGYGHRSSKHFFGAPFLDGRKPSIFLGRGIYTRHKFVTFDVNPATHELTERWRWTCNVPSSPWYGNGFHNYAIADVDMDGRDEIIFGSMTIDDNGKGLSTTGLGHGDAQHHGDFDPYTWGLEIFTCLEEGPVYGNALRDATTSKLYYKYTATNDDGRAIMGNFSNAIPGAIGTSSRDPGVVSAVTRGVVSGFTKNDMAQNFRIYWDGDLLEETFNYINGKNTEGGIYKYGVGRIATLEGSLTNNDTKGTACYQGDLFGDWREEVIMRTADNKIRIYSTSIPTTWRNYSLWHDHQYRNGMVWQMNGYNQPPHTSYFLGELENITVAPPAFTMSGRTEIANGGTLNTCDGILMTCETNDMTINIANGASPYIYIDNAPSWVQGSAPSEATIKEYAITYDYYTHTLQGGAFTGTTRVVKQGEGILTYPELDMTYTGNTDVWGGTLNLNGSIANSPIWMNRHTHLNTAAKNINVKSLTVDYGSTTNIGGDNALGSITAADSIKLGFGSRLRIDLYASDFTADKINANKLIVEKKNWANGPEYNQPIIEFNCHFANSETTLTAGNYNLGTISEVIGDISNIKIEGISKVKTSLAIQSGSLILVVEGVRDATNIEWNGSISDIWDIASTENFATHDGARAVETFIEGDNVYFTDDAQVTSVKIAEGAEVKPANIYYTGTKEFTIGGTGKITTGTFYNQGFGAITMTNENTYDGGNHLMNGTTIVSSLANDTQPYGNLGRVTTTGSKFTIENGAILQNTAAVTNGSAIKMVQMGIIKTGAAFTQQGVISGDTLVKTGTDQLTMSGNLTTARTVVREGSINYNGSNYTKVVELQGSTAISGTGFVTAPIYVAPNAKASLTLTNTYYATYSGAITGTGQLTINPTNTVNRVALTGNWNSFKGTIVYNNTSILMPLKNSGMPNATLKIGANTNIGIASSSNNASVTYAIGKLIGSGTLRHKEVNFTSSDGVSGDVTWKVGNTDLGDFTFDGVIYDAKGSNKSNFEKVGNCEMTTGADWDNSGTVKVSEGTLSVGQGNTLGTGALTVAANATLQGLSSTIRSLSKKHPFTNSSITINGIIRCGSDGKATSGFWYFDTKPVIMGATSKLYVGIEKQSTGPTVPGCTHIWGADTGSSITFQDGATICVYLKAGYSPVTNIGTDEAKADSFYVFNFANATVGDVKFELPELPNGYIWDTSKFKSGYLYIRYNSASGIKGIAADAEVNCEIYTLTGVRVGSLQATRKELWNNLRAMGVKAGAYIIRMSDGHNKITETIVIR